MNIRDTITIQNMHAAVAGTQATTADPRSADEWIKNFLDKKQKKLNDLRVALHNELDHPPALDEYLRPEMKAAWREDKKPTYSQDPRRVASGGKWAVVSPEDEIISTWETKDEADRAAFPLWEGISPSSTGATAGARVKRLSEVIHAADIFQDPEHGDKTRGEFLKHPKPPIVRLVDRLRMGDLRPSSHGQGSAGTGGAAGPAGSGGATG